MNSTCSSYFDDFWRRIWHPDSLRTITLTCSLAFIMNYLFYGTTFATGQQLSGIDEERNKTCRILGQSNICDDSSLVFLYSVLHAHLKGVHVKTCARTGTEQTIYIYIYIYIDLYTHHASLHIYVYLNASRDCRSLRWGLHTETWLSLSQHSLQDVQRRQTNPKIPSIPNGDPGFLDRQMGTGLHQLWKCWSSPWQNLLELCWPGCFCQSLSPISIHSLI